MMLPGDGWYMLVMAVVCLCRLTVRLFLQTRRLELELEQTRSEVREANSDNKELKCVIHQTPNLHAEFVSLYLGTF